MGRHACVNDQCSSHWITRIASIKRSRPLAALDAFVFKTLQLSALGIDWRVTNDTSVYMWQGGAHQGHGLEQYMANKALHATARGVGVIARL